MAAPMPPEDGAGRRLPRRRRNRRISRALAPAAAGNHRAAAVRQAASPSTAPRLRLSPFHLPRAALRRNASPPERRRRRDLGPRFVLPAAPQLSIVGHGDSINEIRTQVLKPSLIVSASKDESVRLWNVHTGICILIFAGAGGHRNEVLSVDFHPSDIYRIASCGMDNTVKIWSMKEFWTYVEKSFTWTDLPSKFPTKYVQFPVLTASVHSNYVDCNRWLGDFILSKSVDNEIVLWEPKTKEQGPGEGAVDILQKYPVPECDIWFIKFSCDFHYNAAAIGNREGKIFVWEIQACPPVLIARLSHSQCKSAIRQTAMSVDGSTILGCCEDGSIWRWDALQ